MVWAELEYQDPQAIAPGTLNADNIVKKRPLFRLYGSYRMYDGNWSTPRVYIENYSLHPELIAKTPKEIAEQTQSIAVYDHSTSPESMVLMLYSNYQAGKTGPDEQPGLNDTYDFLRTVRLDKNFHVTALFPLEGSIPPSALTEPAREDTREASHVRMIGHIFADRNAGRFQYWLPSGVPDFGSIVKTKPHKGENNWDFRGWQSRINDAEIIYDRTHSNIELTVSLNEGFDDTQTVVLDIFEDSAKTKQLFKITLVYAAQHSGGALLLEGSTIEPVGTDFMAQDNAAYCFLGSPDRIRSLIYDGSRTQFSVPRTERGGSASLRGKMALIDIEELLYNYSFENCWRFTNAGGVTLLPVHHEAKIDIYGYYKYPLFVAHPVDVISPEFPLDCAQMEMIAYLPATNNLAKDSTQKFVISIDQTTYRPDGWNVAWPPEQKDLCIPLIFGVKVFSSLGVAVRGAALKAVTVGFGEVLEREVQLAPSIQGMDDSSVGDSPSLGKAQYIDFKGSNIEYSERDPKIKIADVTRAPIRTNTTFARTLIERAESGMESLLSWDTQHMKEPPIPNDNGAEEMDFSGAYWLYFVELFLYLPWLVAYRLNEEQRYDEAKQWLAHVFDPSRQSSQPGHAGYWQAVPLENPVWPGPVDPSQAILYPDDPHQIGLSFPVHFQKALFGLYIDIETNQADQAYRELTPDGLAEAKLRYVHVQDMLGPNPNVRQVDDWTPVTLHELSSATNPALRQFEQRLISQQRQLQENPPLRIGRAPTTAVAPLLCLRPHAQDLFLLSVDNPYLRRPFNLELVQRWERVESRLYNLRHNLDMAGNALNLPLFAAPLDPRALLAASGQGLSGTALSRLLSPSIPHYRFSFMFALAQNAVESVIQFGSTLLSLIERKEQAQYLELQQQQAWNLAKAAVDIQVQAGKIDEANKNALKASQAIIAGRVSYYENLLSAGVSAGEIAAGSLHLDGRLMEVAMGALGFTGEMAKVAPNIFGFANGGHRIEGALQAPMHLLQAGAAASHGAGEAIGLYEQYRRRAQEWTLARDQAKLEAAQVDAQLAVYEEQHKATQLQLRQAQTALSQAKTTHDFLLSSNRFSKSQTYNWLNSKFSSFYYTAYTTALSMCQMAEACWQYEMGDFSQTFIRPGTWNSTYRGLGSGEELKMSLVQMHQQYLRNNARELEIRKTVSVRKLKNLEGSANDAAWQALLKTGSVDFELTQALFDDDYKDQKHYMRRVKTVSVSLPNIRGPYQDVCAILSQSYSKVEMSATIGANVKENLRASQQIALSTGLDDNGLFQLNFQDERYLPFECIGAVSKWNLKFPNTTAQKEHLESLNDIIFHLNYTARSGGAV